MPVSLTGWFSRARGGGRPRPLNLALQGGGAHGAFTWGVLDRLLEAGRFRFAAVSGTSAGAVNLAVMLTGLQRGGPEVARAHLRRLWLKVARLAAPIGRMPAPMVELTADLFSPYQFNPLGLNPFADLLAELIDVEALRHPEAPRLLVAATRIADGRVHLFTNETIGIDAVLASACLPRLHHAVRIDGHGYWDGGYTSNPPLVALIERSACRDTLLVRINRHETATTPRTGAEIRDRVAEIVFGLPLERELAQLALAGEKTRLAAWTDPRARRLRRARLHVIDAAPILAALAARTKSVPDRSTLEHLFLQGRAAGADWLDEGPNAVDTAPAFSATGGVASSDGEPDTANL